MFPNAGLVMPAVEISKQTLSDGGDSVIIMSAI